MQTRDRADNADFSRRRAPGPEEDDEAELIARALQRENPHWHVWHDPEARAKWVEGLRDLLAGREPAAEAEVERGQEEQEDTDGLPEGRAEIEKWNRSRKRL